MFLGAAALNVILIYGTDLVEMGVALPENWYVFIIGQNFGLKSFNHSAHFPIKFATYNPKA